MTRTAIAACIAAAAALAPAAALAQKIRAIEVAENTKTNDDTVIMIAGIEEGDHFSFELAEQIKVRLVSSFLFKEVDVFSTPYKDGVKVTIIAKDKHSWVVGPTFYNQPGNRGGGLGFLEANLFGNAKRLVLYGQIATADSFFIAAFQDPTIGASRFSYQLDLFVRREKVTEYSVPSDFTDEALPVRESTLNYFNAGAKGGITILRAFTAEARLRGAYLFFDDARLASADVTCDQVVRPEDMARIGDQCDEASGVAPEPGAEGWDISGELVLQLDRRANWYGIRTGSKYVVSYEQGLPELGSDFEYWYAGVEWFKGGKGLLLGRDNLVFTGKVGYGEDIPFQQEYSAGGTLLRGYNHRQFRGDFRAIGVLEYSVPMFTVASLSFRALAFYDTTYIGFFDQEDDDEFRNYLPQDPSALSRWRNGVGGGMRVYFKSVVVPLFGFDVGYGLEEGDVRTYLAVGLTEF